MPARPTAAAATLVLIGTLLTACSDTGGSSGEPEVRPAAATAAPTTTRPTVSAAGIEVVPADGVRKVRLDATIAVRATNGRLSRVSVRDGAGHTVKGRISEDGSSWSPTRSGGLDAGARYRVAAVAVDADGLSTRSSSSFTTLRPRSRGTAYVTPGQGWTVGVGMPVVVSLSHPVDRKRRAAVEKAIKVTASPATRGSWRWFSDSQVQWRPAAYWKSGTDVKVTAALQGVQFAPGTWGKGSRTTRFTVGSRMISTVDMTRHTLTVTRNGKVLRRIPITTGKPGFETRRGVKVIMGRESSRQMNSETTGIGRDDAEYYNVKVKWAMRLTYSGEFLHAAPWSVGSQGRANVSHGCTGMSTAAAQWLFSVSKVGDVVKYVGGRRALEWGNGYTAWNRSFKDWSRGV